MSDEQRDARNAHIQSVQACIGKLANVKGDITRLAETTATLSRMVSGATGGAMSLSEHGVQATWQATRLQAEVVNLNIIVEQLDEALAAYGTGL